MFAEFSRVSVLTVSRNDTVLFLYLVLRSFSVIFFDSDICFNSAVVLTCDGGRLLMFGGSFR